MITNPLMTLHPNSLPRVFTLESVRVSPLLGGIVSRNNRFQKTSMAIDEQKTNNEQLTTHNPQHTTQNLHHFSIPNHTLAKKIKKS